MSEELYIIAKAERAYRSSALQAVNPRSKTEVREGSMGRRTARRGGGVLGGSVVGSVAGGAAGKLLKLSPSRAAQLSSASAAIGGSAGSSYGRTFNVSSGDVRATNRRTGKKAKGALTLPKLGSFWTY